MPVDYSYLFMSESFNSWLWLRGGGVRPDHFVKLYFEIALYKQTRAREQTFEGFPDSGGPRDSHTHICGSILPNDRNMLKTILWGALLVATNLLNTCI